MDPTRKAEDFVEIYHTDTLISAEKIIHVVLAPESIEAVLHNRRDEVFPAAGQTGAFYVAVPLEQREKALGLLDEARENGFLDDQDGARIGPS